MNWLDLEDPSQDERDLPFGRFNQLDPRPTHEPSKAMNILVGLLILLMGGIAGFGLAMRVVVHQIDKDLKVQR